MFLTLSQTLWSETGGVEASKPMWFWGWSLRTTALVNPLSHSLKIFFHTFTLLKLPTTPSPSSLPPEDHFYFNVNRKQKYSEENFLVLLHPHLLASTGAPRLCLPQCHWGQPLSPATHYIPSLLSPESCFPLHGVFPISTQVSLSLSLKDKTKTSLKISRCCCGPPNHTVTWNFWISVCIFLFS